MERKGSESGGGRRKTPVVLFIFKRSETLAAIIGRIRNYAPDVFYVIADGPRDENERLLTEKARALTLSLIDWQCRVVTRFSETNVGVYRSIGEGAKWVFEHEEKAIFLEDDNFPEVTFFRYCDTLLDRYEQNSEILWICGTNYLADTRCIDDASYYYTRLLLPCGWASWARKFLADYDGELLGLTDSRISRMKATYLDERLFWQELQTIKQTRYNYLRNPKSVSWDRQMAFSIRSTGKFGIAPSVNQIRNIGADQYSTHGGTSTKKVMTARFCEVATAPLDFPLAPPAELAPNSTFEARTEQILLYPLTGRIIRWGGRVIKRLLLIDPDDSLVLVWKNLRFKR